MTNRKHVAIDRDRRRHALASVSIRPKGSDQITAWHDAIREKLRIFRTAWQILGALAVCEMIAVCTPYIAKSVAQSATEHQRQAKSNASPIYGIELPAGYRDWHLISVKRLIGQQLTGSGTELRQLRAELGNDLAIKAYRDGTLPFPDGSMIAAVHWNEDSSDSDDKALAAGFPGAGLHSTFAGAAVNVQFMVKDSKKYAASGGWGFADFTNGKPGDEALHSKCFPCHTPVKDRDYVFTRYAPMP
jgi:hypothetical protein